MIVFLIIAIAYLTYVNLSSIFRFKQNRFDFKSIELKLNNKSRCYMPPLQDSIQYFSDILDDEYQPKPGKSIFFLETSCSKKGITTLNAK